MIRINSLFDILLVDTDGYSHQHVLRALDNFTVDAQQIGALQSFETKVVVIKVTVVDNFRVKSFRILCDDLVHTSASNGDHLPFLWFVCSYIFFIVVEKDLSVVLCKFETAIRAASCA